MRGSGTHLKEPHLTAPCVASASTRLNMSRFLSLQSIPTFSISTAAGYTIHLTSGLHPSSHT